MMKFFYSIWLVFNVHTAGHLQKANDYGVDWKIKGQVEYIYTDNQRILKQVQGAGFIAQDKFAKHIDETELNRSYNLANAVHKTYYMLGGPKLKGLKIQDDLGKLGSFSRFALYLTAVSDIYRFTNPDAGIDLDFWQAKTGQPGIMFTIKL